MRAKALAIGGVIILIFILVGLAFSYNSQLLKGHFTFQPFGRVPAQKIPLLNNFREPHLPEESELQGNSKFLKVNPAPAPLVDGFREDYYPLFNLNIQNISDTNLILSSFRVNFGREWQVPTDNIDIFDDAQQKIGNLTPTDDGGLIFANEPNILSLDAGQSKIVTVAWRENIYPKRILQKTKFTLQIPQEGISIYNPSLASIVTDPPDGPLFVSLNANLPPNLRLGYRQAFLDNAITAHQQKEKITFVVNKGLADLYPEWKTNAQNLINAYNEILAKNTSKQLEIGRFMILGSMEHLCPDQTSFHPEYYLSNGSYGGLTVFYTIDDPATVWPACNIGFMTGGSRVMNGQNFGILNMNTGYDPAKTYPALDGLGSLIHEAGHSFGLASPEWYQYFRDGAPVEDLTGVAPKLPPYIPSFLNGNMQEPMISGNEFPYSRYNAFIINHNGNHKFTTNNFTYLFTPRDIKLKVVDVFGKPVKDAEVKIFGMRTNALQETYEHSNLQPLLQSLRTNSQGEAMLLTTAISYVTNSTDPEVDYTVKAVKVTKGGKQPAGVNYSTLDLQYALLMNRKDIYEIKLTLQ